MSIINYLFDREQAEKELQSLGRLETEADINTDLNAKGETDGFLGNEAQEEYWINEAYIEGYLLGIRKRYDSQYQVEEELVW